MNMTFGWMAACLFTLVAGQAGRIADDVPRIPAQLDAGSLPEREEAEIALTKLGRPALPELRRLLACAVAEPRSRLERVIRMITEPRWLTDRDAALRRAAEM